MTIQPGLPRYLDDGDYPPLVRAAVEATRRLGIEKACVPEVGALLLVLAARATRIGETGTACGVGAAWLASGMREDARLVTIEVDETVATAAAEVFAEEPRVTVVAGDAGIIDGYAPFDLFFVDGGFDKADPGPILELVAPGGLVVLDDLTPEHAWTEELREKLGEWREDPLRIAWRAAGADLSEVGVTSEENVLLAVKR